MPCNILKTKPFKDFIFFVLLCICLSGSWPILANDQCEIKIFTRNSKVDLSEIKSLFRSVDLMASRTLIPPVKRKLVKNRLYTIILIEDKDFKRVDILCDKAKGFRFYLPENTKLWLKNDTILTRIVAAIILDKCGYAPDKNHNKLPLWLIHGILSKVKRRLNKANIPGIMTFPGMHMLLTSGKTPDLLKISSSPVMAGDGPAYKVSMEAAEILLESVGRLPKSRVALRDLIDLSMKGIPAEDSFLQIFSKKVHTLLQNTANITELQQKRQSKEELKDWLVKNATLMAVNAFKPGNAEFAEKRFRQIEIVRYLSEIKADKEKVYEERYCTVEDLVSKKKEIKDFPAIVRKKELEFARLEFSVTSSLQSSLSRIKKALHKLRIDSSYDFQSEFLAAKKEFYNEIEKFNEIEVYLKKMELKYVPASWRYHTEMTEVKKLREEERRRWPALTKYLDSIEKE